MERIERYVWALPGLICLVIAIFYIGPGSVADAWVGLNLIAFLGLLAVPALLGWCFFRWVVDLIRKRSGTRFGRRALAICLALNFLGPVALIETSADGQQHQADLKLRASDPAAYLAKLEAKGRSDQWWSELKVLDPARYEKARAFEQQRASEEQALKQRLAVIKTANSGIGWEEADLVQLCKDQVLARAKFTSKAKFPLLDPPQAFVRDSTADVRGGVELMNGFGAMIPHRFDCSFGVGKDNVIRITAVEITEGG